VDVPSLSDPGLVDMVASVRDAGLGPCQVSWTQTAGPVVSLTADGPSRSFIARRGIFRFEVVATCGGVASPTAAIEVTIRNLPPLANATRPLALFPYGRARLSARFASDANGDDFGFWWDQVLGGPVVAARPGASLVVAEVGNPGLYSFRVGVTDRTGREGAAEVPVIVVDSGVAPTAVVPSAVVGRVGDTVLVDASASYRSATGTFVWEQVSGPPVALDGAAEALTFVPAEPGRYEFKVSVVDAALRSPAAQVDVFVARSGSDLPVARVSAPTVARVGAPASLDGSASSGAGTLKYTWRQVSGPAAGLSQADKAVAKIVPFDPGSVELELVVEDGDVVGVPVVFRVEARDHGERIPVAVASGPATAAVGSVVTLNGEESVGAEGFSWTQVAGPWVPISGSSTTSPTFTPLAAGTYGFELEVDDDHVRSAPARVDVVVIPNGTEN
jgi:K319-like protein